MVSLENNKDWQTIVNGLAERRNALALTSLDCKDEIQVRWYQGMAQELRSIISHATSAKLHLSSGKERKSAPI